MFELYLPPEEQADPIRVCVSGAAGQIAYSLLNSIVSGDVFGSNQLVTLMLLDIPPMMSVLRSVVMELEDCSLSLLHEVVGTQDLATAFNCIDVAILLASMPRVDGMERNHFIKANTKIYEEQGKALNKYAKKTVKVLCIGEPANTNCLVMAKCAPSIPSKNFTSMTRLDHNRAISQVALRLGVNNKDVKRVIIWGNRSSTKYPDLEHATVNLNGDDIPVKDAIHDDKWITGNFIKTIQGRDAAIVNARRLNGTMSIAKAIADHMRSWWSGTQQNDFVSMGVLSDGSYNIPENIYYSFPVRIDENGEYTIVQDLALNDFSREKLDISAKELLLERSLAFSFLQT